MKLKQSEEMNLKQNYRLVFILVLAVGTHLQAQGGRLGYTTYYFSDSGNNTVITTAFELSKNIFKGTTFLLDIELDNITVPPITAITGATRPSRQANKEFNKTRGQVILGLQNNITPSTSVSASAYHSQEIDYISNSVIGSISKEFFQKNTTLTLQGQYMDDLVGKIEEDGSITNKGRYTGWAAFSYDQLLSPVTVLSLNYDVLHYEGLLNDPYRKVMVFDQFNTFTIVDEKHPKQRLRQSATAKITSFLTHIQASLTGSYRFYFDDWGVQSHTGDVQFNKYVFTDFVIRFNYRYYTQTSAEFWKAKYVGEQYEQDEFRTSDYKLNPFNSNNFGLSFTYLLRGLRGGQAVMDFLEKSSVELRYFRYFNDLEFSANIWQLNINFSI
jgi:hypothetical protein